MFNSNYGIIIILLLLLNFFWLFKKDSENNTYRCETKELSLNGVIIYVTGRTGYRQAQIDNHPKPISLNVNKELFRMGFNNHHFFEVGDSIIKAAGSKEVTVKNKDSIVRFTISCSD